MSIKQEDMNYIYEHLSEVEREKLKDTTVLITGCGGFLGYYFMNFFKSTGVMIGVTMTTSTIGENKSPPRSPIL